MKERTNDPAGPAEARRADHGITITEVEAPASRPLRRDRDGQCIGHLPVLQASCLCGWLSPIVPSRQHATAAGQEHTEQVRVSPIGDNLPPRDYLADVAASVAERIRERGTVLTVDELATVAMALDCNASDLLPAHLDPRISFPRVGQLARPCAPSTLSMPSPDDLEFKQDDADPYIGKCPDWCQALDGVHRIESCDEDRYHFGEIVRVPIRALTAERFTYLDTEGYILGHVEVYLLHNVLRADPHLHLDVNGTTVGVNLTLDEGERIGRTLLAMVEAAR